jgi:DNA gyrase subunit A
MRYTEVRLAKVTHSLLDDLDKNTVDFRANYDDSLQEPVVLPARFPNLLVNGAGGIAVGMATNIPPHNLGEVINATIALIGDPALARPTFWRSCPARISPRAESSFGRSGIRSAYETGRGSVIMRGKIAFDTVRSGREAIIVTEVPYQVNKPRWWRRSLNWSARSVSRALPTCATNRTATACASSSS